MVKSRIKFNPADYRYKSLVIDTSVLVKFFLNEDGADVVYNLMEMRKDCEVTIFATPMIVYEFLNVLAKTFGDSSSVMDAYCKFKEFNIGLIDPDDKFIDEAVCSVCKDYSLSYYDASYHALAKDMGAVFLTADKKYYDAMKGKGNIVFFE
jgi:predicted nucleic acid-binding protein